MNKEKFLFNLNDFQNKAVDEVLKYNKVIIKSKMFTGKSMICKKLFNKAVNSVVIYHTGCCPELFEKAKKEFYILLKKYRRSKITVILDEFYDKELLEYIGNINNFNCYVVTNDNELLINNYSIFNYYHFYKKFVIDEVGEELNIHQIMNEDYNYSKEKESLRRSSKQTITYIKTDDKIIEDKMEI